MMMDTEGRSCASSEVEEVLDLTGSHLHDLANVELLSTLKALDLTLNRLRVLDPRILALTGLHTLSFRQNLLSDASQLDNCASKGVLQELVLHDNHLTQIPDLAGFEALQKLELSYNRIESMEPLTSLGSTALQELYLANNALHKIEGVCHLTDLRLLELGSNKVRQMEGLHDLTNLQELWLGRNRISSITSLHGFCRLGKLSLQSNRLTSMEGLEGCQHLEELYLSHNGISRLQGLASLPRLKILDVSNNTVTDVEGLEHLHQLQDLWLNDNRIEELAQLNVNSPMRQTLTCLYINGNPCVAQGTSALMKIFPNLQQIDDKLL